MYIKNYSLLLLLLLMSLSCSLAQDHKELAGNNKQLVDSNINLKELIRLVTFNQIKDQSDGEYSKGDWKAVKNAKAPKMAYWSYPTGVRLYAMQSANKILTEPKILDYIETYFRISSNFYKYLRWQKYKFGTVYKARNLSKLWRLKMLDDCGAMGTALLELVMHHNIEVTPQLQELIDIIGNYVTNVQPRLDDGTFWRPNSPNSPTIWADDLFMSLPFLVKWSEYKKDKSYLTDAAFQIISFASYLQDDTDGVWYHGYYVKKKERTCCKWGRGNGWVAVAIAEVLSALPENHPNYKRVLEIYKAQISGIKKYQAKDGLWHQVLDHPELSFGTETSCSAQFTFAIARGINEGWLSKEAYTEVVKKSVAGLRQRITVKGGINKVCKSTSLGDNLEYYNNREIRFNDHHGNGLMLLALTEAYKLFETNKK